jgi:hypothetical protein
MRTWLLIVLTLALVLGVSVTALAQDPPPVEPTYELPAAPPATATEGLAEIGKIFAFVTAWLTYQLVKALNSVKLPNGEAKARWTGLGAAAITAVVALASDVVLTCAGIAAGWLDKNGFWTVFLWGLVNIPASWAMYQTGKFTGALPDVIKVLQGIGFLQPSIRTS